MTTEKRNNYSVAKKVTIAILVLGAFAVCCTPAYANGRGRANIHNYHEYGHGYRHIHGRYYDDFVPGLIIGTTTGIILGTIIESNKQPVPQTAYPRTVVIPVYDVNGNFVGYKEVVR